MTRHEFLDVAQVSAATNHTDPSLLQGASMCNDSESEAAVPNGRWLFLLGGFAVCLGALHCLTGLTYSYGQSFERSRGRYEHEASGTLYAEDNSPVHRGFVIADGVDVKAPYRIRLIDQELHINDLVFTADELDLTEFNQPEEDFGGNWRSDAWGGRSRSRRVREVNPMSQLWDACHTTASMEGVVVLSHGMRPLLLEHAREGHDLLVALLKNASPAPGTYQSFDPPAEWTSPQQREAWNHVVAEFKSTPEFTTRASDVVARVLAAGASSEKIIKASLWANSISYPLTLFAMIIVVVAFGHLLSNKPCLEQTVGDSGVSPETRKVVLRSLLIFALLSVVDLVWTIAASATGSMREMNPLGNEFINDPTRLIVFKTVAVSLTITLLYSLHHRPIAQVASWWSCLVLTLLTARWLTFNSMFM